MPQKHKLSLKAAVFICMNIVIGAGVFINSVVLPQKAGALASFSYLAIGLLLLPLIATVAELLRLHPAGGFYIFGAREIHPLVGFLASWSYAVAKVCSISVIIHSATLFAQRSIPVLATLEPLWIDISVLLWFGWLNTLGTKTGAVIQNLFLGMKLTALLVVITTGFLLAGTYSFTIAPTDLTGFGATLPLVLFATVGFEAVCAISAHIKNSRKNAPRAILISYGLVVFLYTLYQLALYLGIGPDIRILHSYVDAFPALMINALPGHALWSYRIVNLIYFCIIAAALGGSYGILFTNTWNIYHIARHGTDQFAQILVKINKQGTPSRCALLQIGMILVGLTIVSKGHVSTQMLSAFGCAVTYFICTIALLTARLRKKRKKAVRLPWPVILCALISCIFLLGTCINQFIATTILPIGVFIALMSIGSIWFFFAHAVHKNGRPIS